ncbi:unnamed protein product [Adineta steineri]|uniref:Uncharacterized protein n=1 Tax=Adineta steineri TaxID=433720 RepID=A0A816F942_9BILA|nr:unnamed protein product [Adineta steineri]CAF1656737.1 unnamed protein product [Adineta steineri]
MFNYATIKHLLLLYSDIFEDRSNSSFSFPLLYFYSRISNMNIGAWPLEKEELTNSHVQYRETGSKENTQLFWTKSFLQTSPYDNKRYRQIASHACERIVQEECKPSSSKSTLYRPSSIIAVSLSETSTRQSSSNNHLTPQTITLPISSSKKSSHTRFSCYLKSHNTKIQSKQIKKKLPTTIVSKNNNYYHDKNKSFISNKNIIKLKNEHREKMCQKCLKIIQTNSKYISSNNLCEKCLYFIRNSNNIISIKRNILSKTEENELRKIIEIVIEEFQDQFGQALNLSIKQMTQHLLSNINLFYNHYQQEFEHLTKKYRLTFLERFIQLMNKFQTNQKMKSSILDRNSITHPPDILSMSSLNSSLTTEKDRSETIAHLTTPSDSISLSTTSNRSIIIDKKNHSNNNQKQLSLQHSSSKKTFTINGNMQRQSFNKFKKSTSSSLQLIDAYRFRDTLRMNNTHFSAPRPKIRANIH